MNSRQVQSLLAYRLGLTRWLFIHIPKNAGTAIRKTPELRWRMIGADPMFHVSKDYVATVRKVMSEQGQHHGLQHARLRDIKPSVRARVQPVAVVRNPWARVVSRYRFALLAAEQGSRWAGPPPESFEAFLDTRHEDGNRPYFWHRAIRGWYPQADYVTDEGGAVAADVLRQEHMDTEVPAYFGLDKPIARRNVTVGAKKDWRSFYTPETIQIVADWYAADIDTFGFDFDTGATRNIWSDEAGR